MITQLRLVSAVMLLCLAPLAAGQDSSAHPDQVVKNLFWGQLMAGGGETFFCRKPFSSKGFTVTEGYVYPLSHVRNALKCGTPTQCEKLDTYRRIASDLHNIVPVQTRVEMRRRNAMYNELGQSVPENECGMRESTQFVEPRDAIKGDIARIMAYMVQTYDLPWLGMMTSFLEWSRIDPPDARELERSQAIAELQGRDNPFVLDPGSMANL